MKKRALVTLGVFVVMAGGLWMIRAQEQEPAPPGVAHAECQFFGPQREHFLPHDSTGRLTEMTAKVTGMLGTSSEVAHTMNAATMPSAPGGSRTFGSGISSAGSSNLIDVFIWQAFQANGATPAAPTNDFEFIRRVTLDLTGRIPAAADVLSFVGDTTPNKRANLIETLLASSQWVDRWTMFFGDLYKNAQTWPSTGTSIASQGRDAFNTYIRAGLTNATPYNQVASALIGSEGTNNFAQGELNWIINGRVTGTGIPIQDTWDQETANVADTFLGISHLNCLLCHNGRGHLDTLSLWGANTTRMQAWGMSSFLAHTNLQDPLSDTTNTSSPRLWYVNDAAYKTNYALNTTTGNRPPRQPVGTTTTIAPNYVFTGQAPNSG